MRRIYVLNVEELHHPARQEIILAGLNLQRRKKAERCRRAEDRIRSLAAGALLQYGLGCWWKDVACGCGCRSDWSQDSEENAVTAWQKVTWEMLEECFLHQQSERPQQDWLPPEWSQKDWTFETGPHGKPYLKDLPVHFNLSHSGELILCGISDREIGVDVQKRTKDDHEKIWSRYFTDAEKEMLRKCDSQDEREILFHRLWVMKEAWGKLTGEGIGPGIRFSPLFDKDRLGIRVEEFVPEDGYFAAVCRYHT